MAGAVQRDSDRKHTVTRVGSKRAVSYRLRAYRLLSEESVEDPVSVSQPAGEAASDK